MTRWTTSRSLQIPIRPDSMAKRSCHGCFQISFFSFLAIEAFQAYYCGKSCRSTHIVRHGVAILLFMFRHLWVLIIFSSAILFHSLLQPGFQSATEPPAGQLQSSWSILLGDQSYAGCTFTCINFAWNLLQIDTEQPPGELRFADKPFSLLYNITLSRDSFSLETTSRPVYAERASANKDDYQ
jgi:hypothetical protein